MLLLQALIQLLLLIIWKANGGARFLMKLLVVYVVLKFVLPQLLKSLVVLGYEMRHQGSCCWKGIIIHRLSICMGHKLHRRGLWLLLLLLGQKHLVPIGFRQQRLVSLMLLQPRQYKRRLCWAPSRVWLLLLRLFMLLLLLLVFLLLLVLLVIIGLLQQLAFVEELGSQERCLIGGTGTGWWACSYMCISLRLLLLLLLMWLGLRP